jgi:hypothetical protein
MGPCYTQGFHDGEAVLGPLLGGVERKVLMKGNRIINTFGNGELVDPRFKGWVGIDTSIVRVCAELGARYSHEADVDDLQRHGIHNARYIDLV